MPTTFVVKASSTGRVEGDVAGAVDDRVQVARQVGDAGQVALEHLQAGLDERVCPAGRVGDSGEDRLLEQGPDPLPAACGILGPDEHGDRGVGRLRQQPVQQGFPDEAGDAGEQDLLPAQARGQPGGSGLLAHARSLTSPASGPPAPVCKGLSCPTCGSTSETG